MEFDTPLCLPRLPSLFVPADCFVPKQSHAVDDFGLQIQLEWLQSCKIRFCVAVSSVLDLFHSIPPPPSSTPFVHSKLPLGFMLKDLIFGKLQLLRMSSLKRKVMNVQQFTGLKRLILWHYYIAQ